MRRYFKFSCSMAIIGLLGTACKKEATIIPDQPSSTAPTVSSGRGNGGSPQKPNPEKPAYHRQLGVDESSGRQSRRNDHPSVEHGRRPEGNRTPIIEPDRSNYRAADRQREVQHIFRPTLPSPTRVDPNYNSFTESFKYATNSKQRSD